MKKISISLFSLVAFLHFSPQFYGQAFGQDWITVIEENAPLIGNIQVKNGFGAIVSSGSGFIFDQAGFMLTNAHVIRAARFNDNYHIEVNFEYSDEPQQVYTAQIDQYDSDFDLCILDLGHRFSSELEIYNGERVPLMSPIIVAGYPLGQSFKSTPGFIQAFQQVENIGEMLDLSAQVVPGNSGGPVIDQEGRVLGMVTANIPGYNFNLALPSQNLVDFIAAEENLVTLQLNTTPSNARIFLNGSYKGMSPLSLELLDRNYSILIEKDGYLPYRATIGPWSMEQVNENITLDRIVVQSPRVTIATNPDEATIFLNNRNIGNSPVTFESIEGRKLRIRIEKPGYSTQYHEIIVENKEEQEFFFDLD